MYYDENFKWPAYQSYHRNILELWTQWERSFGMRVSEKGCSECSQGFYVIRFSFRLSPVYRSCPPSCAPFQSSLSPSLWPNFCGISCCSAYPRASADTCLHSRGLTPNVIKVAPSIAVSFYTFETVRDGLAHWEHPDETAVA